MNVSLFASSIRPQLWAVLLESLIGTTVDVEIIFSGNLSSEVLNDFDEFLSTNTTLPAEKMKLLNFRYLQTGSIKPAQAYEVARRACTGELVCWIADDCEFPDDVIGKSYRFWKEHCGSKDVVCIRTKENYGTWRDCNESCHNFFANTPQAPKMAPIGMMSREYFDQLGGIDRRYICGQWDNDLMMRVYNDGGNVRYFGDATVLIDHAGKHDQKFGVSMERPFARGFAHDRKILESAWGRKGQMVYQRPYKRYDKGFEPYEDKDLATVSQSYNLENIFHD